MLDWKGKVIDETRGSNVPFASEILRSTTLIIHVGYYKGLTLTIMNNENSHSNMSCHKHHPSFIVRNRKRSHDSAPLSTTMHLFMITAEMFIHELTPHYMIPAPSFVVVVVAVALTLGEITIALYFFFPTQIYNKWLYSVIRNRGTGGRRDLMCW